MENYVRKIIRESINALFEVREGSSGVIGNLSNIIRSAEISFPTPSGMQKFSTDNFEIKAEIIERINTEIRKLSSIPHTSTLQNAIKLNPTFDSPRKEASVFQHREDNMYLYKLGTFWAFENGEYKKVIFNESKLKETYPLLFPYVLSSLFGIDSMFVIVYKDKFSSFGFYNSNTSDGELEVYMKKMAKKKDLPVIENGYIISGTYSKKHELLAGKPISTNTQMQGERPVILKSLVRGGLAFIPRFGWGEISYIPTPKSKEKLMHIAFPKKQEQKVYDIKEPKRRKMSEYLDNVEIEEKKFDPEILFMNARRAQASQ